MKPVKIKYTGPDRGHKRRFKKLTRNRELCVNQYGNISTEYTLLEGYLSKWQIERVLKTAEDRREKNPMLRVGQSIFNALFVLYPHMAKQIRNTQSDMFYHDDEIINTLMLLQLPDKFVTKTENDE